MNCWEILALQPGAEERDIKRRYAQLVKLPPGRWSRSLATIARCLWTGFTLWREDQWQEEEEEQPINMSRGIVHPRPVMTFRAPNTFLVIHFLMSLLNQRGNSPGEPCWICSVRRMKQPPNTPPCNLLRRYLSLRKRSQLTNVLWRNVITASSSGIPAIINSRCSTNVQMAFSRRQSSTRNPDRN